MKVYNQIGSKERFVEIFQRVNKVNLNEDHNNDNIDAYSILLNGFQALKNGQLSIQGGGSNNTTVQMTDNESTVEINGLDSNRNNYKIVFNITYNEGDQEGVYNIETVTLTSFEYRSSDGTQTFDLDENGLIKFNQQFGNDLFDVVEKFVDVKSPNDEMDIDELQEAVKLIDAIKQDSYPFGGDTQRMQTGKAYGDEKPTNPALRVKSPELDKHLNEEDADKREMGDYPNAIGSKFKPKKRYPSKKKKPQSVVKLNESTDRDKYENVVFLQGDEAYEPLERLDREGEDAALEYLKQWHYPGEHEGARELLHGRSDKTYEKDGYTMSWNPNIGYIGLQFDLSQMDNMNEVEYEDVDDETTDVDTTQDDGMSLEPKGDEIEQLSQDKEEVGDMIPGGLGDDKSPMEFDPEQVKLGIGVEMEHSENPMLAMEIVLDHLTEDPQYYSVKDDPEASAQFNASTEAGEKMDDKDMTDMLLGYQPKNVGDDVDEEFIGANGANGVVGNGDFDYSAEERDYWDKQNYANGGEGNEPETNDDLEQDKESINESLIKTARQALNKRGIVDGMTKKEAVQILIKHNIK